MTSSARYKLFVLALGWLVLIGLLFNLGFGKLYQTSMERFRVGAAELGQAISNAEGDVVRRARHSSRSEYLEPLRPVLDSVEALKDPPVMLVGAYDGDFPRSFAGLAELEKALHYKFPLVSFYNAWGDRPDQQFPRRMIETITKMGSVPIITWEPWIVDFDPSIRTNLPLLEEREYATLRAIAKGDYDFYVVQWAKEAAAFGKPMFVRFAHEMNDPYRYPWGPQNGNRPDDFVAAWIHVHTIFEKMGATNVLWVWSPHVSMPWIEYYYPGDEYVDWIGIGVLNYGDVASWSRWWSFHQILNKAYPTLTSIDKPIMISELGSLSTGGDLEEWYRQAFYQLNHHYGKIRGIVLFNASEDRSMSPDWPLDWSITQEADTSDLVAREIARIGSR